jgi:hypothetical protein
MLSMPESLETKVFEGFEPILVSEDVIDDNMINFIDIVMDSSPNSSGNLSEEQIAIEFGIKIKKQTIHFIGEWIDELKDGFTDGMTDTVFFFRENINNSMKKAGGEEMGAMLEGFGTDMIMGYITKAYNEYTSEKQLAKQQKPTTQVTPTIQTPAPE